MKALFDSDIFAYRAASACEDEDEATAQRTLERLIVDVLMCGVDTIYPDCFVDSWSMHLTGKNNFRYEIATTVPYKGNRVDKPKPKHLAFLRNYLVKEWGASISEGEEADDTIAIEATKLGDNCVIGDTTNELELYNKVLEAYEGDAERVLENAQLLFLRRYEGQIWTPPQA
jgi:hypothetical protein